MAWHPGVAALAHESKIPVVVETYAVPITGTCSLRQESLIVDSNTL